MTDTKATEGRFTATVKAVKDDGAEETGGSFEAILSMPTLDRDNEIVDAKAFLPLPERITIDVDHGMSVETTVGSGVPSYDGDVLKISGTFASTHLGQTVRTLVKEGHIDRMSVAYMNAVYTDDEAGIAHLTKAELLNAAIVAISSNREALIFAAKEAKLGARNSASDKERIQNAHDLFVELGAECETKHAAAGADKGLLSLAEVRALESVEEVTTTDTDPEDTAAATAAATPPADVTVALALAELCLVEASLASLDAP